MKNAAILFAVFVVIPSVALRYGFEKHYSLKKRKLGIHDNAVLFLIPSGALLIVYNLLLAFFSFVGTLILENSTFTSKTETQIHISAESLFNLNALISNEGIAHALIWYLLLMLANLLMGKAYGKRYKKKVEKEQEGQKEFGTGVADEVWPDFFKTLITSRFDAELYVRTKGGDIFTGKLNNYGFDGAQLSLLSLKGVTRYLDTSGKEIELTFNAETADTLREHKKTKDNLVLDKFPNFTKDLKGGVIVITGSEISNIWFIPPDKGILSTEDSVEERAVSTLSNFANKSTVTIIK